MLSVRACARGLNLVVLLLCTSELDRSESTYLLEESAAPFIDEGVALQERVCERKRVCVLPSLVAHAIEYRVVCRHP